MIKVWCEWDMGQNYFVFSSQSKAEEWMANNWPDDTGFARWQDAWAEGFIGYRTLTVDPE